MVHGVPIDVFTERFVGRNKVVSACNLTQLFWDFLLVFRHPSHHF